MNVIRMVAAGGLSMALSCLAGGAVAQGAASTSASVPTGSAATKPVKPPPIEEYAQYPKYARPLLSPNGQHLAVLVPINERMNVAVLDLATRQTKVLTSMDRYDASRLRWVGNDHLVFSMGRLNTPSGSDENDGGGLFMVSRDGSESRGLSPTIREIINRNASSFWYPRTQVLASVEGSDREVYVSEHRRTKDAADVYRLDVTTGRRTLVTVDRPANVTQYILDLNNVPRVAVTRDYWGSDARKIWYRDSESSTWRELLNDRTGSLYADGGNARITPVAFDEDNKNLLVLSNQGQDTQALFRFDVTQGKLGDSVASHPRFDMGPVMREAKTRRVIGVALDAEQPMVAWFDESMARLQATIDRALPNRFNNIIGQGDRRMVVSMDDVSSPQYLLLDVKTRQLELLLDAMPWIKPGHFVPMRPFLLKTRDGLEIPSYYFLPLGHKPGDKLPTVLHIHGGPTAKADTWGPGWNGGFGVAEAQLLASRGYAVVLPNFRGTPGLGTKVYVSGRHSVGRKMSEDHEDAAKWAVDQGFADPKRLCITGASYGGYATLQALVKTPNLFQCGIAGLPVSNMELQLVSTAGDTYTSEVAQRFWRQFLLGEDVQPGISRKVSPVHHAEQIKAPLMFYAGAADVRTPIEQTNGMVSALKRAGQNPEVMIKTEEGHGYGVLKHRVELWEMMLAFLDKHIGAGPTKP